MSFLFSLCVHKPPGFSCLVPEPEPPGKEDDAWVQRGWETSAAPPQAQPCTEPCHCQLPQLQFVGVGL